MRKFVDLTGQKFERLTAIKQHHQDEQGYWYWSCRCDCGEEVICKAAGLIRGVTKSCGCFKRDRTHETMYKHGMSKTKLDYVFRGMKARCYSSKHISYKNYGGRGIYVCEEWLNDSSLFFRWAAESGYEEGLVIDRIDNNGPYSSENCRWVSTKESSLNRSDNRLLTFKGKTQTVIEWADELDICVGTIRTRLGRGRTIEDALSTSILKSGPPSGNPTTRKSIEEQLRLTLNGVDKTVKEWASSLGLRASTIYDRLKRGCSIEEALSTVKFKPGPRKNLSAP